MFKFFFKKTLNQNDHLQFLKNSTFNWERYKQPISNWGHEHCEFCGAKFMETDVGDVLREGWVSQDGDHWVCAICFEGHKEEFQFNKTISFNQKDFLISIVDKAKSGKFPIAKFNKDWEQVENSKFTKTLYEDIYEALVHLPSRSLFSNEIDYDYWHNQYEYKLLCIDLLLLQKTESEFSFLSFRESLLPEIQALTLAEIIKKIHDSF